MKNRLFIHVLGPSFEERYLLLKTKKYLHDYIDMFDVWVGKWGGIKLFIDIKQECCTCTCT